MLVPCPDCGRHVRDSDETCPRCSATRGGMIKHTAAALALGLMVACSGDDGGKTTGDTGTTASDTDTDTDSDTDADTDSDTDTDTDSDADADTDTDTDPTGGTGTLTGGSGTTQVDYGVTYYDSGTSSN